MRGIVLEWKKEKRTGILPAFLGGGILAGAVPLANMAFRSEMYLKQYTPWMQVSRTPFAILLDANWQMMAMLNMLLVVTGACLLYHTEYADNGLQKMRTLPLWEGTCFLGKTVLLFFLSLLLLAIEAGAIAFCAGHWFEGAMEGISAWLELGLYFGYAFLRMVPCILLSLLVAEACRNMWISLGIGVLCLFTATLLPAQVMSSGKIQFLAFFPFAMPFRMTTDMEGILENVAGGMWDLYAAAIWAAVLVLAGWLYRKGRRAWA